MRPCRCGHLYSAHVGRGDFLYTYTGCNVGYCPCEKFEERAR